MIEFTKLLQDQFNRMWSTGKLFRSSLSGQQVWDIYINAFEKKHNPIFRDPNSSTHNCNLCKNFIRRYGNIVAIDDNYEIISMFDVSPDEEFKSVVSALSQALQNAPIGNVFFETYNELVSLPYESCSKSNSLFKLGIDKNVKRYTKEEAERYGVVLPNEIRTFNHLHLHLPKQFVDMTGKSEVSIMSEYRDAKNVFQKAMQTISVDTYTLVKDLILQDSLLDGNTHLYKINEMIPLSVEYNNLSQDKRDNWCWVKSYKLPFAKFKNELIGVLCSEIAEGKELNEACQAWNKRVDPANYMKATAPITRKQIEEARQFVEDNGYKESFDRRFATIDDIKASEIRHINVGDGTMKQVSLFDNVKATSTRHKRSEFDKIEEVSIEKFMSDILPNCSSVEAFFENRLEGNLISLTTAVNKESKRIFKWSNNYSWTFKGNLAGKSQIKEAVKKAGGKIEGILRFSITWNEDGRSIVDLDAHCQSPRTHIYYANQVDAATGGCLDVDMINPSKLGVENIVWPHNVAPGLYHFYVKNYNGRTNNGFKAEIEMDGDSYFYNYLGNCQGEVNIAKVRYELGRFSIEHQFTPSEDLYSNKEIYGIETNQFHKINLICLSPNHWDENGVGNKYYMFMLENCKSPSPIRSFHAENLIPELAQHRKVLEVLGNMTMINPSDKQLSGLGFNATVRDEVIVKIQGSFKRMLKIKF